MSGDCGACCAKAPALSPRDRTTPEARIDNRVTVLMFHSLCFGSIRAGSGTMGAARIERMTQRHYSRNGSMSHGTRQVEASMTPARRGLSGLLHDDSKHGKPDEQQCQQEEHVGKRHHHALLVGE